MLQTNKTIAQILSIVLVILGGISTTSIARPSTGIVKWAIEQYSTLTIAGKSNVNSFKCRINVDKGKDTIELASGSAKAINLSGKLKINIRGFDCGSTVITKDLGTTLKADKYPELTIRFINLAAMPSLKNKGEIIRGQVEVELAGVTKRFELNYTFYSVGPGNLVMNGHHTFSFSDFDLTAPCKLGCLVKIKDDFDVTFQLILRML